MTDESNVIQKTMNLKRSLVDEMFDKIFGEITCAHIAGEMGMKKEREEVFNGNEVECLKRRKNSLKVKARRKCL